MDGAATSDLADAFEPRFAAGTLAVLGSRWLCLGSRIRFGGRCVTLQVFEDNSLVVDEVKTPGRGRDLVVDGGRVLVSRELLTLPARP